LLFAGAGLGVVGVVLVEVLGFDSVAFWRRCSTTAGPFADGFAGAFTSASCVVAVDVGAGVGVLEVVGAGAGVLAVGVEVVVGVVPVEVGFSLGVVSVGVVPVPSASLPVQFSAASAPPESGPSPAAVKPPPAIAEISARHARLRMPEAAIMRRSSSSRGRPMVVVGACSPQTRVRPPEFISAGKHQGVKDS
jgi:hypothetical protein